MASIAKIELHCVVLEPHTRRVDAIQSFERQETPIVRIVDADGVEGVGYSYTIGTGGSSVMRLLEDHLCAVVLGREASDIEAIWQSLKRRTHATTVGPITSLAIAAIDMALWDLKSRRAGLPLHRLLGGARAKARVYSTEGGWLHLPTEAIIDQSLAARDAGFSGVKMKVGLPSAAEDARRVAALRKAVGDDFEIMVDCNQSLTLDRALRLTERLREYDLAWIEEPFPADDIESHVALSRMTTIPVAIGESLYSLNQFKDYLHRGACTIVQADVARVGGVTPWIKIAHLAEACGAPVCPHFLTEIHAPLTCAVAGGVWVEYIPQLDLITHSALDVRDGYITPSDRVGSGIEWDWEAIMRLSRDGSKEIAA